jgi:hypothetical protein
MNTNGQQPCLGVWVGAQGHQRIQHSPQSRRVSNLVHFMCACETPIHRPSRWGEEWLINCFLAVKEIHPGTGHLRSRSFGQGKILHCIFFFYSFFCGDLSKEVLSYRDCCRPIVYKKERKKENVFCWIKFCTEIIQMHMSEIGFVVLNWNDRLRMKVDTGTEVWNSTNTPAKRWNLVGGYVIVSNGEIMCIKIKHALKNAAYLWWHNHAVL